VKTSPQAAARRYARALLDVAVAQGDPAALRADLLSAAQSYRRNAELRSALTLPGVGADRRQKLVAALFTGRAGVLFLRLVQVLAAKDRVRLLPFIADAYAQADNERLGILAAEAVTATPIDETQTALLRVALQKASGRQIDLATRLDARLLGGLVVTLAGRTYDGSVRAQLATLKQRLLTGAGA
jgi:F-type H+-transporting ATPase subunit delta